MRKMLGLLFLSAVAISCRNTTPGMDKPQVAFSFDDPSSRDLAHFSAGEWNSLILSTLDSFDLQAILYVQAGQVNHDEGKELLQEWNDRGHLLGNHSCTHLNYSDSLITSSRFMQEVMNCDTLIASYSNYRKLFRFPLLKTGNTIVKRDVMRIFLSQEGYKHGWVTIDNSDWYINTRLVRRLARDPDADISAFRDFYVEHIFERACYYNDLSKEIFHREIPHTLLLHHNLSSALFLDDLLEKFVEEGWEPVDYSIAISDTVYSEMPEAMPSDQSLVWLMAMESGNYEGMLRYPPEDSRYEKAKMDSLGL